MSGLTMFQALDEVNRKNYFLFDQLTETEQKSFHPLVLLKWMNASNVNPIALQQANHRLFSLSKSQQFLVLAAISDKKPRQWKWSNGKPTNTTEVLKAIEFVYDTDRQTAEQVQSIFSQQELDEILKEYRDDIKASTKEKKRSR